MTTDHAVYLPNSRLSVLMTNFNHAPFLRQSLLAILEDPRVPTEVIVIDDASTDDSVAVLESIRASDPRLQIHRNTRNVGILANLKRLLEMATAEYIYFAAADDFVLPGFFEKSLAILARHPEAGLCSTLSWLVDEHGRRRGVLPKVRISTEPAFLSPARVRKLLVSVGAWIQGNTVIYRRQALEAIGGFRPELEAFTDSFAAQIVALRDGACFIPEVLAVWRTLPRSYSARIWTDASLRDAVVARAVELMEGPHAKDFPPGYAQQWSREIRFATSRTLVRQQRDRRSTWIAQIGRGRFRGPAQTVGAVLAWLEWAARFAVLLPTVPPHVVRRTLYR